MGNRPSAQQVNAACYQQLADIGFHVRNGACTIEISPGVLGWIGLNVGKHKEFIRINVNVGLHFEELMKLLVSLEGGRYIRGRDPTYAIPLLSICPQKNSFEFVDDADLPIEAIRIKNFVAEHGVPFMEEYASYEKIIPRLKEQVASLGGYPQRYAGALYLSGDADGARRFIAVEGPKLSEGVVTLAEKLVKLDEYFAAHDVER